VSEIRLFVSTTEPVAEQVLEALSNFFGEEDYAIATQEIDEAKGIWEASIYGTEQQEAEIAERFSTLIRESFPKLKLERETLPDIDWIAKSLEGLKPVRAGRFLVHGSHDRRKRRPGDLAIEIEAGLAFGTGHHGTTAGCLELIETVVRCEHPKNARDLGTGSAVLAIALAKLAHIPVLATDIDPVATRVAAQNVKLNRVSAYVETRTAAGFGDPIFRARAPFDLIVANILARPLMRMAPDMARSVRLGGSLILSGILQRQRNAVLSAYVGQSLRHVRTLTRGEWVTLHLKR
jgi:ribosomal protein L11 methyltransferase